MDFNLKQWRNESEDQEEEVQQTSAAKLPTLLLNNYSPAASSELPLFVPAPPHPTTTTTTTLYSSSDISTSPPTKFPRILMGGSNSYFSLGQWQELELQALIFRHMIAGAAVPPELVHLVNNTLPITPYYPPLHHYHYHHHPPLVQSGYWGKSAMDPEPGRCRRTDGKKWRCSRDVVSGQKYCERHMHRGRNRSRKPVEIPTPTTTNGAAQPLKTNTTAAAATTQVGGGPGGIATATPQFTLSGPLTSMDLLHLNRRPLESISETHCPFEAQNDGQGVGGRTLRHFFDDWPRSLHETDNAANSTASATNLTISMPGNPSSDFSLKLGTGTGDESRVQVVNGERERPQLNWGMTWGTNRVGAMGGPLAEALRSSASTSSPTSVLHRLQRSSASETSYISS